MSHSRAPSSEETGSPTLGEAFWVWLRIGLLSFGGPAGQIALMHRMLVDEKKWVDETRFLHALNFCMLLPGPEAQQLATYIGWLLHRTLGGLIAGLLFILPGALVILALSFLYVLYSDLAFVEGVFFGIKAAIIAVVVGAVVRLGSRALGNSSMMAIASLSFIAIFFFDVPFPIIVAMAAMIGFLGARYAPHRFEMPNHGNDDSGVDLVQDHVPIRSVVVSSMVCAGLWILPIIALLLLLGPQNTFTQEAIFFSKMAVVTFGGAYAVLTYVAQQAVEHYAWLTPTEMVDGLGLAETTPGPLIMVVQFVGFLGAYRAATGLDPLVAGTLGAFLVTWVTFAPCFLWIFLGAPFVERLRGIAPLQSALAAITAAVVGVVLNLAVWFAAHVMFGEVNELAVGPIKTIWPVLSSINPIAALLSAAALFAILRLRLNMLIVLAACAFSGVIAEYWVT